MRKLMYVLVILVMLLGLGVAYAENDVLFVDFLASSDEDLQDAMNQIADELKNRGLSVTIDISENTQYEESSENIRLNQTIKVSNIAEFTITKINYSSQVKPPKPGDYYTYYALDNLSNRFIDLTIKIKNLTKNMESVDHLLNVVVIYDNTYEYTTQAALESSDGKDLNYASLYGINPLNTSTARFFVELPKSVVDNKKNIKIKISIGNNTYYLSGD